MKRLIFISIVLVAMLATAHTSHAQGNGKISAALAGNATMFSEDGGKTYGISIGGKTIVAPKFLDVKTRDGKYFAVNQDEKWGIVNAAGKQLVPCEYKSISISAGGNAVLTPFSGGTELYNCESEQFVVAKEMSSADLRKTVNANAIPGTEAIDYSAMSTDANVKKAKEMLVDCPDGAKFEITPLNKDRQQELIYKGEILFKAAEIQPVYKDGEVYEDGEFEFSFFFITKDAEHNGKYGIYRFDAELLNSKIKTKGRVVVPPKYDFLKPNDDPDPDESKYFRATVGGNTFTVVATNGEELRY
jgi:hypothetical protein